MGTATAYHPRSRNVSLGEEGQKTWETYSRGVTHLVMLSHSRWGHVQAVDGCQWSAGAPTPVRARPDDLARWLPAERGCSKALGQGVGIGNKTAPAAPSRMTRS